MANTYTQIHLQMIFAPKYRAALIGKDWQERLHQYITGIVQGSKHKMIKNQEEHHKRKTFLDEYRSFLQKFKVEYDERYILKEPE